MSNFEFIYIGNNDTPIKLNECRYCKKTIDMADYFLTTKPDVNIHAGCIKKEYFKKHPNEKR